MQHGSPLLAADAGQEGWVCGFSAGSFSPKIFLPPLASTVEKAATNTSKHTTRLTACWSSFSMFVDTSPCSCARWIRLKNNYYNEIRTFVFEIVCPDPLTIFDLDRSPENA
mgnify:CR=1 FL=1